MYVDKLLKLSDAQALTATAVSTNVIDLSSDRDIGIGEPMGLVVTVGVAADYTSSDETYKFTLQTATDAAFSSAVTVFETAALAGNTLPAGAKVVIPLGHENLQFLRVNYTLAGTSPSATVDAFITPLSAIDGNAYYASGYTV